MQLDGDRSVRAQATIADSKQPSVGSESVPFSEDGPARLAGQIRAMRRLPRREVRQIRDDDIDRARNRLEQIAVADDDPIGEAVATDVRTSELDRLVACVGGPDDHVRRRGGDGDRHRP